jgi:predicted nucleic acid-binding protein
LNGYLLDTNHLGQAVTRGSLVRQRIEQGRLAGTRFGTCIPVLCELEVGIQQVKYPEEYRRNLRHLLKYVRIWPMDLETARLYGEINRKLRRIGRVLSTVDEMVAALARQLNVKVLTTDGDFDALPEVKTENWTIL